MSQSPQKGSIQITLHQRLQKREQEETVIDFAFQEGKLSDKYILFFLQIYANFSGEIVASSSVLAHRVWSEQVFCSIQLETCSEFSEWTLSRSLTINYLTKVIQLSVTIIALALFIEIVTKTKSFWNKKSKTADRVYD